MAFRLCLALGYSHPDELLMHLSHRQFEEWIWASNYIRFPDEMANLCMARQVWAALQPHSKKKLKESSYLINFNPPPPTPEAYRLKSMRAYLGNGGKINGKANQ